MVCFADFTDALFNPTKGTEKTTKPPKQVKKERKNIISNTFGFPVNPNNTNWVPGIWPLARLLCSCPFLLLPPQSSSDYVSPYELPLGAQPPADQAKESEAPAAGNKALEGDTSDLALQRFWACLWLKQLVSMLVYLKVHLITSSSRKSCIRTYTARWCHWPVSTSSWCRRS